LANQRRVPLIAPSAGTHELSGLPDYFFRVLPDTRVSARRQAEGLLARGHRRLVTVADMKNRAFSKAWSDVVAEVFAAGGGLRLGAVEFEAVPGLVFSDVAKQAASLGGDIVMIAASATDSSVLAQHIHRLDARIAFALSAWAGTEQLPAQAGRALDGAQVPQFFDRNSQAPAYLDFVRRFTERFGEAPGYQATNAYDSTTLGVRALQQSPSADLLTGLRSISTHRGLQREIGLDANGDCTSPVFLTELRDGRYVMVER
jgi:branched-chain amino acid transport system substrate-binding protein